MCIRDRLISSEMAGIAQALPIAYIKHCNEKGNNIVLTWAVVGRALEDKTTEGIDTIEAHIQVNS